MPHKWIRSPWCVLLISVLYASQIRCTQLSKDRTHVLDIVCNGEVSVKTREEGTDSDGCLQAAVYQKCGMSQHKCDLRHNYCDPTGTCYPCTKICSSKEETKFACSHHCKGKRGPVFLKTYACMRNHWFYIVFASLNF